MFPLPDKRRNPTAIRSLREVAKRMGISTERARQLEQRALCKLRRHPELRKMWEEHGAA